MQTQNGFPTAARQLKPEKRVRIAATAAASNKKLHNTDYFQFALPTGKQYDTDKMTIANQAAVQAVKKVKDKLVGK